MSNIAAMTDIFKMDMIDKKVRAKLIIKLGTAINNEYGMNLTEALVYEMVKLLDPTNPILEDEFYKE